MTSIIVVIQTKSYTNGCLNPGIPRRLSRRVAQSWTDDRQSASAYTWKRYKSKSPNQNRTVWVFG